MIGLLTVVVPAWVCHQKLQEQEQRQGWVTKPHVLRWEFLVEGRSL